MASPLISQSPLRGFSHHFAFPEPAKCQTQAGEMVKEHVDAAFWRWSSVLYNVQVW